MLTTGDRLGPYEIVAEIGAGGMGVVYRARDACVGRDGIFHVNDKAERLLTTDPSAALLVMHTSFLELVKTHYRTQSRWQVSDKKVLADLRDWEPALACLVERFVSTTDTRAKFETWTEIVEYVMAPLGGRKALSETNCPCDLCRRDFEVLATESILISSSS